MFPCNQDRVQANTPDFINNRIRRQIDENISRYGSAGPKAIAARLAQLDREWDIERYLETVAPTLTLVGMGLGLTRDRRWFVLPAVVQSFFLQHALQGWCPPIPVLRRLGIRTQKEIEQERFALKALRGDFREITELKPSTNLTRPALAAAAVQC